MAVGAFLEPLVVVSLLFGGAYFNRNRDSGIWAGRFSFAGSYSNKKSDDVAGILFPTRKRDSSRSLGNRSSYSTPAQTAHEQPTLRRRKVQLFSYKRIVSTPNTLIFKDRFLSRALHKFPFLTEAWYWALIYWVYQLGRAFTAVTFAETSVEVARAHALQVIHLEQQLHIFWEVSVQKWLLQHDTMMHWVNRIYSFIHIPGTISFLVVLFYLTTTRTRRVLPGRVPSDRIVAGPGLYEARRRTMAVCNLLAFVVFTLWPCMPPRLLSDLDYNGENAAKAKSFGFVDTVHSGSGESSVWTTNKFCNQYAAMPSLHFGYSLLIGLTISTFPMTGIRPTSWKRIAIVTAGMSYPTLILTAIVATANHFILDAVAGAMLCGIAWHVNDVLLNLCVVEDYFLWLLRIHKPVNFTDPETAVESEYQMFANEI